MTDAATLTANLRRPKILLRAARLGMQDYRRDRDLKRLVHSPYKSEETITQLIDTEQAMEDNRKNNDLGYSFIKHIEVMIALLCEVNLLPRKYQGA
jgi:hypothetical protein